MNAFVDPGQIGLNILGAFKQGQQEGQQKQYRNALAQYATNPTEQGLGALAPYDPQFVMQERQKMQAQQKAQQQAELQQRAAQGDKGAMAQLAGIDINAWGKLNTDQRAQAKQEASVFGNAALDVLKYPPEQRPQVWDAYIEHLSQQFPDVMQYKGKYSEQLARDTVAQAEMIDKLHQQEAPHYQAIPAGGTLVDTSNPGAVQQYQQGMGQQVQPVAKAIGNQTYYQNPQTGKWYDNPQEAGGGTGNGVGGF